MQASGGRGGLQNVAQLNIENSLLIDRDHNIFFLEKVNLRGPLLDTLIGLLFTIIQSETFS